MAALERRNLECARLLIEHCDVNRLMYERVQLLDDLSSTTNFFHFVEAFLEYDELHHQALALFMGHGADVDMRLFRPFAQFQFQIYSRWNMLFSKNHIPKEWHISVLEWCFYLNRPLYRRLRHYSRTEATRLTRAGVLGALEHGLQSLRDYLTCTRPFNLGAQERYLQLILAEQFSTRNDYESKEIMMDPHVTLVLLEHGVDPTFSLLEHAPNIMSGVVRQIHLAQEFGTGQALEIWMSIVKIFVEKGVSLDPEALNTAVQERNISLLHYLVSCTANINDVGCTALAEAARLDDFEAVDLLLRAGVDINSYVGRDQDCGNYLTVLAFAVGHTTSVGPYAGYSASYKMMKYLIENGAKLLALRGDWHPCHFLRFLVQKSPAHFELAEKVRYITEHFIDFQHPDVPSDGLLEACFRNPDFGADIADNERQKVVQIFDYLRQKGARVYPGATLAQLIQVEGSQQLIQELILAGADIHAYSGKDNLPMSPLQAAAFTGKERLVQQLLSMGAEIEREPLPKNAATALQWICYWPAITKEEISRKLRITRILLKHGADVNASNKYAGTEVPLLTPLQQAAAVGSLDVAMLLLSHGANINLRTHSHHCALDVAAEYGRLDMVQFLLNANAISGRPGNTGYDGAIEIAGSKGRFALVRLIEKHAETNSKLGIVNIFNPLQGHQGEDLHRRSESDAEPNEDHVVELEE
ncbi:hypothetical protein VPNG_07330 [Cytospora leucostoma]|uniref:Uncharacterized protein n=1 Tax=Cytospora leucostoma TaxID=1230097 RepID=A0A423WUW0_9PEZI|nr:hypothetical protein VPNG_07330 [Cytospora leucostoma]